MQSLYKKVGLSILAMVFVFAFTQLSSGVNAEEFTYYACSATDVESGDFQSLSNCDLVNNIAWCNTNSGSINVSYNECVSLANLYEETNGSSWSDNTNWFSNTDITTWEGFSGSPAITISGSNVVEIHLDGNNLSGTLLSGLNNLSYLVELNLQDNNIAGSVDASNNTSLQQLFMYNNPDITSVTLPATSTLTEIGLSDTSISSIDFSQTPNAAVIDLSTTQLTSVDFSGLANLRWVDISENSLTSITGLASATINYLDVSNQAGRMLTSLDISAITGIATINALNAGLEFLTIDASLDVGTGASFMVGYYPNATSFNFNYNSLCDISAEVVFTLNAEAGVRESRQLCPVSNLDTDQYYYDVLVSRDTPSQGLTGLLSGYTVQGANMSGTAYLTLDEMELLFPALTITGINYDFTVCAIYDTNGDDVVVCDDISTMTIDPYYFLTEVTPVAPVINALTAFYQFSFVGTGLADVIATPCGSGAEMYVSDSSGGVYDVSIQGLQDSTSYTCSIAMRSADVSGSIYSNRLDIGPFSVDISTQSPTLIAPTSSSSHERDDEMDIGFVLPEAILHNSLTISFVPNDVGQDTITLQLMDAVDSILNTFTIIPAGNLSTLPEVVSTTATSIPNGTYTVILSYQDIYGNPAASTIATNITISNSLNNSGGGGGGGGAGQKAITQKAPNISPAMWKAFYAEHMQGATSTVGDTFTIKAFITDVFTLLDITKPINRKPEHDTEEVPQKLVDKVMQVLVKLLTTK